jgi:hypothetical protein
MFQTKFVEKIKTHILCSVMFSKNCAVCEIKWKKTAGQATDDNIIQRTRFACWITKARHTLRICNILLLHGNYGNANAPQFYVVRTLLVLLNIIYISFKLQRVKVSTASVNSSTCIYTVLWTASPVHGGHFASYWSVH